MLNKLTKHFQNPLKWTIAGILIFVFSFYALSWVVYGLEYARARNIILKHYGGVAKAYNCFGGAPTSSIFNLRPRSFVVPADGIAYSISAPNDGIAEGYVGPSGGIVETNPPQWCQLE